MPSGATTCLATAESGRRLVAGAVPLFIIGVHDHRVILVLRDDDGLDLLADLELATRERSQVAGGSVRVIHSAGDPSTHGSQLLETRALLGRFKDGRRTLRVWLLVGGDGAECALGRHRAR